MAFTVYSERHNIPVSSLNFLQTRLLLTQTPEKSQLLLLFLKQGKPFRNDSVGVLLPLIQGQSSVTAQSTPITPCTFQGDLERGTISGFWRALIAITRPLSGRWDTWAQDFYVSNSKKCPVFRDVVFSDVLIREVSLYLVYTCMCSHHQHCLLVLTDIDVEHTGISRVFLRHQRVVDIRLSLTLGDEEMRTKHTVYHHLRCLLYIQFTHTKPTEGITATSPDFSGHSVHKQGDWNSEMWPVYWGVLIWGCSGQRVSFTMSSTASRL